MTYTTVVLVSAAVCAAMFALRLAQGGRKIITVIPGMLLGAVCGLTAAKVLYVLMMAASELPRFGLNAFIRTQAETFCFVGGCAGASAGVALGAKLTKEKAWPVLDAFAPAGALMICGLRVGEMYLGRLGAGSYVDASSPMARFPFAVANEYGEWFYAVFMLEALMALIVAVVFLVRREKLPGETFEQTAFYLAVTQILCENLRARGMKYGFVHAEQLLCAVIIVAIVVHLCAKTKGQLKPLARFWPVLGILVCIGLVVAVEFIRQKAASAFFASYGYGLMILVLVGMAVLETIALKRRHQAE